MDSQKFTMTELSTSKSQCFHADIGNNKIVYLTITVQDMPQCVPVINTAHNTIKGFIRDMADFIDESAFGCEMNKKCSDLTGNP